MPAEVKVSGGVLIVTFSRPVAVQTGALSSRLAGYVTAVRRDPDGRSLRFALDQRVTVNSMEAGERLFVDMLPDSWRGPPPALPAEVVEDLTRRARDAERRAQLAETQRAARVMPPVIVRVGNHPTFTRFVLTLPEPVGVALDRAGDRLSLKVGKPFTSDLRQTREGLPHFVSDIEATTNNDELVIRMTVSPDADVRAFREEGTYVVDVSMRDPRAGAGAVPVARNDQRPPAGAAVTNLPGSGLSTPSGLPIPILDPAAPAPRLATGRNEVRPPVVAEVIPAPAPAGVETAPVPPLAAEPAAPARPVAPPAAAAPARTGPVMLQARRAGGTIRILVPFNQETPGAVFQRGDTLWLVFDAREQIDLAGLQADAIGAFTSVDASRSRGGTAIRIGLDKQSLASTGRDGAAWIVTLADAVLEPPRPVALLRATGTGDRLIASAEFAGAGSVHRLSDPLAGDQLIVVTGSGPARSFLRNHEMVEFNALAGSHGLVFQPLADDLAVTIEGDRVTVGRPRGLVLTAENARPQPPIRSVRRPRAIAFDLELWALDEKAPFREREADLVTAAASVHDTQRTPRRLDLVRFYMAQQRWPEARAVLETILRQDRRVAEDGSIQGLRGVVSVMLHRPADALRDLAHPAISASPDIASWRATALALDGRAREAHEAFEAAETPVGTLPAPFARNILTGAIGAALDTGAVDRAARRLDELQELGVPASAEQQFALLRGRVAEAQGQEREALGAYARAGRGPDEPVRADADQRQLALRYRLGEIDGKATTEELEVMSYAWRGDDVEARTLALLAKLYAEQGRFRDAFSTMRNAMRVFPRSESVRGMQDDVARHFEALFLDGNADAMKPVDALALYYDFRDMTPQGRRGDEIIRRLADRLANMDLLDQAASLLQHQVDRRLTGAARSQVAARLAVVHLMNRKPAAALQALRTTRLADLPEELRVQRYLLEARALADAGRPDQALELLGEVKSLESEMLRADILWSAQRYRESAEQSEKWVSARRTGGAALNDDERRHLLRAAIGYALSDETLGLDRLRGRWRPLMTATVDARAFDVVTAPIEARGVEYREIARSIADRDTLDAFLQNYRERYPSEAPGQQRRPGTPAPGSAEANRAPRQG
ncbi:tetratricopeptide repeat protein [Phreatobacter stygius]|uniref:Tetratricopeptide repeat protein n=1 Tax=Phreatobacter stygius TaxID=1940610 RepID=A0A4D7ATW7_9HYPH|nr:tetratricopeptide repeat protein [Phreatobacter stygius]